MSSLSIPWAGIEQEWRSGGGTLGGVAAQAMGLSTEITGACGCRGAPAPVPSILPPGKGHVERGLDDMFVSGSSNGERIFFASGAGVALKTNGHDGWS